MMHFMKCICVILMSCTTDVTETSIAVKKFVQQKDISEHCRRRVVPSVFLGRQVADSSSHVLHFSRLDVPYSCSISIRTESGSNIILVVQLKSEKSISKSCKKDQDQLLVYEIGETFGGYWGELSDNVLKQEPNNYTTYYTLKTTIPTTTMKSRLEDNYEILNYTEEIFSLPTPSEGDASDSFVVMEVPLVNVSGNLELGESDSSSPSDVDELFDLIYDVTPRNGVLYETSLMPLVQFSVWKQQGDGRIGDLEPRYQLDYSMQSFTPDYRLVFNTNNYRKRKYQRTRRINFKNKNKELFAVDKGNNKYFNTSAAYISQSVIKITDVMKLDYKTTTISDSIESNVSDTWELIERYLKSLDRDNNRTNTVDEVASSLLHNISDMKHNISIYLEPNLSKYTRYAENNSFLADTMHNNVLTTKSMRVDSDSSNTLQHNESTKISNKLSSAPPTADERIRKTLTTNKMDTNNNSMATTKSPLTLQTDFDNKSVTAETVNSIQPFTDLLSNTESVIEFNSESQYPDKGTGDMNTASMWKRPGGSLVDHESWENVVQVAPVMADLLNLTSLRGDDNTLLSTKSIQDFSYKHVVNKANRKKRHIKALAVEEARPRQWTTNADKTSTQEEPHRHAELEDLAEVLELHDDEIQGRVALRYWKSYVGSALFNMCDYREAKARHVYLFNSSRIIIALSNFTLERMTIVVTEARGARRGGCPPAHLECQVSGVRVCVHHANACDGVPNCGSHDIYDEDRLLCGINVGFNQTVCLAACTFLAMLLTLVYSVHYWLKRCVPKVSQAFFVYADKSENILFLDSVMRSPTDDDDGPRLVYNSNFFEDDLLSSGSQKESENKVSKVLKRCYRFLLCRKFQQKLSEEIVQEDVFSATRTKYSFTESELRRIVPVKAIDASVQTGVSLEMAYLNKVTNKHSKWVDKRGDSDQDLKTCPKTSKYMEAADPKTSLSELNNLRIVRNLSAPLQSGSRRDSSKKVKENFDPVILKDEVELHSTIYNRSVKEVRPSRKETKTTTCEMHSEHLKKKEQVKKHLRFEEETTMIPIVHDEDNDSIGIVNERRTVTLGGNRLEHVDLDAIEVDNEPSGTSGRDFMRFWGSSKGKKPKKKSHGSLRDT